MFSFTFSTLHNHRRTEQMISKTNMFLNPIANYQDKNQTFSYKKKPVVFCVAQMKTIPFLYKGLNYGWSGFTPG